MKNRPTTRVLEVQGGYPALFLADNRASLAAVLAEYAIERRWFRSKGRALRQAGIADLLQLEGVAEPCWVALLELEYTDGPAEIYVMPLAISERNAAGFAAHAIVAELRLDGTPGKSVLLLDGLAAGVGAEAMLEAVRHGSVVAGQIGRLRSTPLGPLAEVSGDGSLRPRVAQLEQTNTTIPFGDRLLLKVYRRLDEGVNPELEMGAYLGEVGSVRCAPRVLGSVEYRVGERSSAVAVIQEMIANQGTAWELVLRELDGYLERARGESGSPPAFVGSWFERAAVEPPDPLRELIGSFSASARVLGRRTAELHIALGRGNGDPAFARAPMLIADQRAISEDAHARWSRALRRLRHVDPAWSEDARRLASELVLREREITHRLQRLAGDEIGVSLVRVHGDLHLGQILDLGGDFLFIDFEGEPGRSLAQRRAKRCALVDVSGMMRSFSYGAETALRDKSVDASDEASLRPWARAWAERVSAAYLGAYARELGDDSALLPRRHDYRDRLLAFFLFEKCIYEIEYELDNRPRWLTIPLEGLRALLENEEPA